MGRDSSFGGEEAFVLLTISSALPDAGQPALAQSSPDRTVSETLMALGGSACSSNPVIGLFVLRKGRFLSG